MSFNRSLNFRILLIALTFFVGLTFIFPLNQANAQRRDHLTAEEIEIVRDVQEIDKRMLVFSIAIERRFIVLNGGTAKLNAKQQKRIEKDKEIWGELPKGSQTQLLSDIDKIIDEAVSKIEDVAERDAESKLFPVAVHILADNAKSFKTRLANVDAKNRREVTVINSAIRNCDLIIEASAKVPRPDENFMKKRTKKIGHTKSIF